MRDEKISLPRLRTLHPDRQANFQAATEDAETQLDIRLRIVQALRTFAEQDALYNQSRDGSGKPHVTDAKGGQSWHNFGLAIDVAVVKADGTIDWNYDYSKIAAIFAKYGLTWGHAWKDNDHFEDNCKQGPSGHKWALSKWNKKDTTNGYINLA